MAQLVVLYLDDELNLTTCVILPLGAQYYAESARPSQKSLQDMWPHFARRIAMTASSRSSRGDFHMVERMEARVRLLEKSMLGSAGKLGKAILSIRMHTVRDAMSPCSPCYRATRCSS
eukprot:3810583-Amphidinium_carterae.2